MSHTAERRRLQGTQWVEHGRRKIKINVQFVLQWMQTAKLVLQLTSEWRWIMRIKNKLLEAECFRGKQQAA
jgi:hypothetical protein